MKRDLDLVRSILIYEENADSEVDAGNMVTKRWPIESATYHVSAPRIRGDDPQQMTVMLKSGTAYAQSKIRKAERAKLVDRALADNSIAMTERRSMNDRQFRLNARRLKKEKEFFDIAAHGLPKYVEASGKRIDAETVWDAARKSDGCSGEDIRLCTCLALWKTKTGCR